ECFFEWPTTRIPLNLKCDNFATAMNYSNVSTRAVFLQGGAEDSIYKSRATSAVAFQGIGPMAIGPKRWRAVVKAGAVSAMLLWAGSAAAGFEDEIQAAAPAPPVAPAGKFGMALGIAGSSD